VNKFPDAFPIIYLITKGKATIKNFPEKSAEILRIIETAARAEISLIQIREKNLPARLIFELTEKAAQITRRSPTRLLVNDRADIAFSAKADGVHLTSLSLSAQTIRQSFPKDFIVGVSAHSIEEAEKAKAQGADFATFSPIFTTPNKGTPKGLAKLKEACEKLKPFPVIALGGVDETNFQSILKTGASGLAAIRFLNNLENLKNLTREFTTETQKTRRKN
jgi:thiamine-phosphate pyrophosphorylase